MADYEKVMGNLQILRTWCAVNPRYSKGLDAGDCEKAVGWLDDALEILKEHEPVEPFCEYSVHTGTKWICCGECNTTLMKYSEYKDAGPMMKHYCPNCGKAVKWDG